MNCSNLPCAKFIAALFVTVGSMLFSFIMIGLNKENSSLTPFYCSLISSSVAFWAQPPTYKDTSNSNFSDI